MAKAQLTSGQISKFYRKLLRKDLENLNADKIIKLHLNNVYFKYKQYKTIIILL